MNLKIAFSALVAAAVIGAGCETHKHHHAKISKEQATEIALAKVPGGTAKEGELEKEHGKWIWSFDIATPGTANITEVQVDANSGDIVSVTTETPGDEAKEAKTEKSEKKKKSKKDDDDDEKDEKK
jgi:hypothetical protein